MGQDHSFVGADGQGLLDAIFEPGRADGDNRDLGVAQFLFDTHGFFKRILVEIAEAERHPLEHRLARIRLDADLFQVRYLFHTDDDVHRSSSGESNAPLPETVLDAEPGARVMPGEGAILAGNEAGAALQTALIVYHDFTLW